MAPSLTAKLTNSGGLGDAALRAVHNAASVEALWIVLKRMLDDVVPHHSLSLYFNYFAPAHGFRVLHDQQSPGGVVPWSVRRRLSPAPAFLRQNPGVKTYRLRQLLPDVRSLRQSDYFKQVMRVEGWDALLGLGFWEGERLVALLVLRRTAAQGEFEPEDAALLERWHPHFHDALRRIQRFESDAALRGCLSSSLEMLSLGVMIFDGSLALRFKNAAAERLCVEWIHGVDSGRLLHAGRAFAIPPALDETLRTVRERASTGETAPYVVSIADFTVEARVFSPDGLCLAQPYFLVQLRSNPANTVGHAEPRRLSLDCLTPCEREVARHAADGWSNGQIALRLGKSERTVATQMGAVLAKLNLCGRVQLARLVG